MKGLSHNFILRSGKFQLTSGSEKVKSNLSFFTFFSYISKIYDPEFTTGLSFVLQKPASSIDTFKTLILGKLKKGILKYVPNVIIDKVDLQYNRGLDGGKDFILVVSYKHSQDITQTETVVTFI